MQVVPIWILFKNPELKLWGTRCLGKIVGSVGKFINLIRLLLIENNFNLLVCKLQLPYLKNYQIRCNFMMKIGF